MEGPQPPVWAGYIRESTEDQGKGYSPEVQVEFCERIARAHGGRFCTSGVVIGKLESGFVPPPWVYGDIGGRGWDINRPALRRLLNDAAVHKFSALVVWRQDRLARTADVMRLVGALLSLGVQVFLEGRMYTSSDDLAIKVREMVSEEELNKMSVAIGGGLQKARAAGKKLSRPPLGLEKTADGTAYRVGELGEAVLAKKAEGATDAEAAESLGLKMRQVRLVARNVAAFNEGRLDLLLEEQRHEMEKRKAKWREKRKAERKAFRDELARLAPGKWD